ncbi:MAG: membrane protein insertase YidC [Deltaproteobacteria bacterium]|nr:membrane protein insertase YidC [Deltaproteobacteria bacterium]
MRSMHVPAALLVATLATLLAAPAAADQPVPPSPEETLVPLSSPGMWEAEVSTWGATLRSFRLLDPKYQRTAAETDIVLDRAAKAPPVAPRPPQGKFSEGPIDLVSTWSPQFHPFAVYMEGMSGVAPVTRTLKSGGQGVVTGEFSAVLRQDPIFTVTSHTATSVTMVWPDPATDRSTLAIERTWEVIPGTYRLRTTVRLVNSGRDDARGKVRLVMSAWEPLPQAPGFCGGMFGPRIDNWQAACGSPDTITKLDHATLFGEQGIDVPGPRWVALNSRYFLLAAMPPADAAFQCIGSADQGGAIAAVALWDANVRGVAVPGANKAVDMEFTVYVGPKDFEDLDSLGQGIGKTIDLTMFGLDISWLCKPMLWFMRAVYNVIPSWGVAILLLTLVVKILTFYWSWKSIAQMRKMQDLKPKLDALKERFKDDKAKQQQAMMDLYKREKVNPLGGCLPMLLQMPIWIALYMTIYGSVDLFHAPLFLWITDLSAEDPYYVTPVLLGVLMFVQQKMTPTVGDPAQAKMMLWMMPIMFTWFMLFLPSGLVFYILVNTLLSIAQQVWMNRRFALKRA